MLHARKRGETLLEVAIQILGAFLVVARQAGVGFEKETRARLQTGVDGGGFTRAANEKSGGGE